MLNRVCLWVLFSLMSFGVRADTLPTIFINSAAGQASWNAEVSASFSGPGFSLNFGGLSYPDNVDADSARFFQIDQPAFSASSASLSLVATEGNTFFYPSGSLTVAGVNFPVYYGGALISLMSTASVPVSPGTFVFPAVLAGQGTACLSTSGFGCTPVPGGPAEDEIANVVFNISGLASVSFVPVPPSPFVNPGTEMFSVTFTATPEPGSLSLLIAGLGVGALLLASRRRASAGESEDGAFARDGFENRGRQIRD